LGMNENEKTGRQGMSAESAMRCAILKQYHQASYDNLIHLLIADHPFVHDPVCATSRWLRSGQGHTTPECYRDQAIYHANDFPCHYRTRQRDRR
ncbi:MAG: hypothetical protein FWD68_17940, partial [Alphaproteobacteria bacterium]|nr:hypothetical protein [Alphaproteobacteria bacterium]